MAHVHQQHCTDMPLHPAFGGKLILMQLCCNCTETSIKQCCAPLSCEMAQKDHEQTIQEHRKEGPGPLRNFRWGPTSKFAIPFHVECNCLYKPAKILRQDVQYLVDAFMQQAYWRPSSWTSHSCQHWCRRSNGCSHLGSGSCRHT